MKKNVIYIMFTLILIVSILLVCVLFNNSNNKLIIINSNKYKIEEIQKLSSIVEKRLKEWSVNVIKIWYDEKESYQKIEEYKKKYNVDEIILIYSDFKTTKSSAKAGLGTNKKYNNFTWIFVKNAHGKWELKDFGY